MLEHNRISAVNLAKLLTVITALTLAGCATPEPGSPAAAAQEQQNKEEAKVAATSQTVEQVAASATEHGLGGTADGQPMLNLAGDLLAIATAGMRRRGRGEECTLDVLNALLRSGKSQAEHAVARFGDDAAATRRFVAQRLSTCPWI